MLFKETATRIAITITSRIRMINLRPITMLYASVLCVQTKCGILGTLALGNQRFQGGISGFRVFGSCIQALGQNVHNPAGHLLRPTLHLKP